jgi:hypothetical protein
MFLTNPGQAALIQSLHLLLVSRFKQAKDSDITRLELVGRVRRETTKVNIVFKAELYGFDHFIGFEAVNDQDASLLLRPRFCLRVEDTFEPF